MAGKPLLYYNLGYSPYFSDIVTQAIGPFWHGGSGGFAADFDKDGNLDIFTNSGDAAYVLYGPDFTAYTTVPTNVDHHGGFREPGNVYDRSKSAYYTSRIFSSDTVWAKAYMDWVAYEPEGASVNVEVRTKLNELQPWTSWTGMEKCNCFPDAIMPARFFQYRANLSWSNAASLPWLERMELLSGCLPPDIHLTAQIHDYGTVDVGSSVAWGLIVANVGCQNLVINSITSNHNDFVVIPRSFPQTISPNDSIDVAITFAPSTIGTITGQLTVNSNDPDEGTLSVSLSGYGVAPVGESWWVTTTFTPSSIGVIEGTLTVTSNDPDEPTVDINLSGTGVAAIASVPNVCATPGETTVVSIDVDNQTLKDTPVAQLLLELIFDDSLLVVANVEPTIRTSNMSIFDWDVPNPGQLTIQISDEYGNLIESGTGCIPEVSFAVSEDATVGESRQLQFLVVDLMDVHGKRFRWSLRMG